MLIDAETLLARLRASAPDPRRLPYVQGFLEELPIEVIHNVVLEGHIDFPARFAAVRVWGCDNDGNRDWIEEMARFSAAPSAGPRAAGAS